MDQFSYEYEFVGFSKTNTEILVWFRSSLNSFLPISRNIELIFAAIGVLVNIFHLAILTRPSMRTNCINVIIIGIGVADLFVMGSICSDNILEALEGNECYNFYNHLLTLINFWRKILREVFRRTSAWLGVFMALIRYLVVKNATNSVSDKMMKPVYGFLTVLVCMMISSLISGIYYYRASILKIAFWIPPELCLGYASDYTEPIYAFIIDRSFFFEPIFGSQSFKLADGLLKIAIAVILPVLTVLLLRELGVARRKKSTLTRSEQNSKKSDQTTKMIILMTVASIISEAPLGISSILQVFSGRSLGLLMLSADLIENLGMFVAMNSLTHCFISFVIYTQYRNTVKNSFRCKIKTIKPNKLIPAALLPILSFLLVRELQVARKNRRKISGRNEQHKPDNTTRMVILMTIASVIAEGPIGLAYLLQGVSGDSEGLLLLGGDLISVFEMFVAMNSLSHCLISLIVSTPYQNTVKDVFKCLQKTKKIGNNVCFWFPPISEYFFAGHCDPKDKCDNCGIYEYAEDLFKYKDFKGFGNFTNKFLVTFGNALNATSDTTYKLKLIFAVIGFVVNIFHLMILTRKPMRTSCINVIMVGMGIADFINMTYYLYVELYGIVQNNECINSLRYAYIFLYLCQMATYDMFRRDYAWLVVMMALIRFLVIKNAMSAAYQKLAEPLFGLKTVIASTFLSVLISVYGYWHQYIDELSPWVPPTECQGYPANYSEPKYYPQIDLEYEENPTFGLKPFLYFDSCMKLIPTVALPILTFLLIRELQVARRNRRRLSSKNEK
ncbi:hypothetical protein CRE_09136 [Caenorhabditis remanei]|uniref:G-protein coupled receptors family 1 profile domain-containing protein n=1 Tax=Caenorhabditis remanei TaxID=31234 RepID=E3LJI7_CAERE|nr:hypothetical protein CRE_09136 [Caenorhabditis remanei]